MGAAQSIFESEIPTEDGKPRSITVGGRAFKITWNRWRPATRAEEESFRPGWQASTIIDGNIITGDADLPLVSLAGLAEQLNHMLHLGALTFGVELPLSRIVTRDVSAGRF